MVFWTVFLSTIGGDLPAFLNIPGACGVEGSCQDSELLEMLRLSCLTVQTGKLAPRGLRTPRGHTAGSGPAPESVLSVQKHVRALFRYQSFEPPMDVVMCGRGDR